MSAEAAANGQAGGNADGASTAPTQEDINNLGDAFVKVFSSGEDAFRRGKEGAQNVAGRAKKVYADASECLAQGAGIAKEVKETVAAAKGFVNAGKSLVELINNVAKKMFPSAVAGTTAAAVEASIELTAGSGAATVANAAVTISTQVATATLGVGIANTVISAVGLGVGIYTAVQVRRMRAELGNVAGDVKVIKDVQERQAQSLVEINAKQDLSLGKLDVVYAGIEKLGGSLKAFEDRSNEKHLLAQLEELREIIKDLSNRNAWDPRQPLHENVSRQDLVSLRDVSRKVIATTTSYLKFALGPDDAFTSRPQLIKAKVFASCCLLDATRRLAMNSNGAQPRKSTNNATKGESPVHEDLAQEIVLEAKKLRELAEDVAAEARKLCEDKSIYEIVCVASRAILTYACLYRTLKVRVGEGNRLSERLETLLDTPVSEANSPPAPPLDPGLSIIFALFGTAAHDVFGNATHSFWLPLRSTADMEWFASWKNVDLQVDLNFPAAIDLCAIAKGLGGSGVNSNFGDQLQHVAAVSSFLSMALPNFHSKLKASLQTTFEWTSKPGIRPASFENKDAAVFYAGNLPSGLPADDPNRLGGFIRRGQIGNRHEFNQDPDVLYETFDNLRLGEKDGGWAYKVHIRLPEGYNLNPGTRYPVMYFNDGGRVFFEERPGEGSWRAHDAIRNENLTVIAVAIVPRFDNELRWEEPPYGSGKTNTANYTSYTKYLILLKGFMDAEYRTRPEARYNAIVGGGHGGTAAFFVAAKGSFSFGKCIAFSPTQGRFWPRGTMERGRTYMLVSQHSVRRALQSAGADHPIICLGSSNAAPSYGKDEAAYYAYHSVSYLASDLVGLDHKYVVGQDLFNIRWEGTGHGINEWRENLAKAIGSLALG